MLGSGAVAGRADAAEELKFKSGVPGVAGVAAAAISDTCSFSAAPELKVTRPPANGTFQVRKVKEVLQSGPCKGSTLLATVVDYKSKPGFKGTDTLTYEFTFEAYVGRAGSTVVSRDVTLIVE